MEKRINNKTRAYLHTFKDELKNNIVQLDVYKQNPLIFADILQLLYDYQPLEFTKVDFQKRKRVKNVVPLCHRCCALRANGEQCTRRKKNSAKFCGTHIKGTPHGEMTEKKPTITHTKKVVWAQDIKGIIYYIDDENNVYDTQDIIENKVDPKIIAKYVKQDEDYIIPALSH